jgi:hypothetical protein
MKGNSSIDNKGTSVHPVAAPTVSIGNNGNGDHNNGALNGYDVTGHNDSMSTSKVKNVNSSP